MNVSRTHRGSIALLAAAATVAALAAPAAALTPTSAIAPTVGATTLLSVSDTAALPAASAAVVAAGGSVQATYDIAGALLVTLPTGVAAPAGTVVVPDVAMTFTGVPAVTATDPVSTVRDTVAVPEGVTGTGVTVAVVDTGVAETPDLVGRVQHINVSGDVDGDGLGHGTFMAGLVAGDGTASDGAYSGLAPAATVLDVKVAAADGATSLSMVLAGLQAVADNGTVDVVSLALSTGSPLPPVVDPLTRALDTLWARGMTVVVAAGNEGPANGTVSSPGSDPMLLTVGAVDEARTADRSDDALADFSSRSTRFGVAKPELLAPGVSLISLRAPGSIADVENPGSVVADAYFRGTGTSMSAAVTAGAVAGVLSARPGLTPDQVKGLLSGTGYAIAGGTALDVAAALTAPVPATTANLPGAGAFGPREDDAAAWAEFAAAWQADDLVRARAAWLRLSPQARRWAANAWAAAVVVDSTGVAEADFSERVFAARRWATENWSARRWADTDWTARRWANDQWLARRWASGDWTARRWANDQWLARRWAGEDWLDFAWTARRWASDGWANVAWDARRWAARRWASDEWTSFAWDARRWANEIWTARRWAVAAWPQG